MENLFNQTEHFRIGAYDFHTELANDEEVQAVRDAGVDFIVCTPYDEKLLTLFDKHGVGAIVSYLPSWWGGQVGNSGFMYKTNTVEAYEKKAATFVDHPCIWGMDLGDEPSALDFPQYGKLSEACRRLFPGKLPYVNLNPISLNLLKTLGTYRYAAYTERFIKNVDVPYVCFDNYMYDWGIGSFYEQIRTVAEICRKYGREMWVVLQVNSKKPDDHMTVLRLRHQAYLSLAFGAKTIEWACWSPNWWYHNVIEDGKRTPQYDRLKSVNLELRTFLDDYMRYENEATYFVGTAHMPHMAYLQQDNDASVTRGHVIDLHVDPYALAAVGFMKAKTGDGQALVICDSTNPSCVHGCGLDKYDIAFRLGADLPVRVNRCGVTVEPVRTEDGYYHLTMRAEDGGMFVEIG